MTVMRYGVRAASSALGAAAAGQALWPESFALAVRLIRDLFLNIPWPF